MKQEVPKKIYIQQKFASLPITGITYLKRVVIKVGDREVYASDEFDCPESEVAARNLIITNLAQVLAQALGLEASRE